MQRKLFYIVLLFSFILLQACNNRGGSSYDEGDEHKIVFTLSTKNIETRAVPTRADDHSWNDNFDNNTDNDYETILGSNYDSRINDETVEVLIFDATTGDYLGNVDNLIYFALGDNNADPSEYRFLGDVSHLKLSVGNTYKFMVLVNSKIDFSTLTSTSDIVSVLNNLTFNINDVAYPNGFIPMWGVSSYTMLPDKINEIETIHLLRAVAKIDISLSNEMAQDFELYDVFITQYSQSGYSVPKSWSDISTTTTLLHYDDCFRVPANAQLNNFYSFYSLSSSQWCVYLPEFSNTNDVTISIRVKRKDNGKIYLFDGDRGIKLKKYNNGFASNESFDIVRNHYYEYTITKVNVEQHGVLEITCNVAPWELYEENWDYTDQILVLDVGRIVWSDYFSFNEQSGEVTIYPGRDLKGRFAIVSPVGAQWRAEFIPISGSMTPFKFTMPDTDNMKKTADATAVVGNITNSNGASLFHEFTIAPRNLDIDVNNFAYLRFSVITQDGRTIHVKELTNSTNYFDYTIIQSL